MTKILFVRHGQSVWNAVGRWQGQADPPLSALGEQQAAAATVNLPTGIDAVYASPLERARRTAELLVADAGLPDIEFLDDLVERSVGEWSGLNRDDIEAGWPGYLKSGQRPPAYEHDGPLLERIDRAFDHICAAHPHGLVLVVAHGGIVYGIEARVGRDHRRLSNVSGIWLERRADDHPDLLRVGERINLLEGVNISGTANEGL